MILKYYFVIHSNNILWQDLLYIVIVLQTTDDLGYPGKFDQVASPTQSTLTLGNLTWWCCGHLWTTLLHSVSSEESFGVAVHVSWFNPSSAPILIQLPYCIPGLLSSALNGLVYLLVS